MISSVYDTVRATDTIRASISPVNQVDLVNNVELKNNEVKMLNNETNSISIISVNDEYNHQKANNLISQSNQSSSTSIATSSQIHNLQVIIFLLFILHKSNVFFSNKVSCGMIQIM